MKHLPLPMRNSCLVLLYFLLSFAGLAQEHQAALVQIEENGLHKILLTPEIRAVSMNNTAFLRLLDQDNNEVPYVILKGSDRKFSDYTNLEITDTNVLQDSVTSILITNTTGSTLDRLTLKIANTAVNKRYTLSGSDDQNKWFGLVSDGSLYNLSDNERTYIEKTISFPLNTYAFLRIDIDDKHSLPINVMSVGLYRNRIRTQPSLILEEFTYSIGLDKENQRTKIDFSSKLAHQIDGIIFDIHTPQYVREAKILVEKANENEKRNALSSNILSHFQLNSEAEEILGFHPFKNNKFTIQIENEDNPPLDIKSIKLTQNPLYMLADLKPDGSYKIVTDSGYGRPSYDLVNFISDIRADVPEAKIADLVTLDSHESEAVKSFWQTNIFMWICIVLGIGVVGYFSLGLLKDMKA